MQNLSVSRARSPSAEQTRTAKVQRQGRLRQGIGSGPGGNATKVYMLRRFSSEKKLMSSLREPHLLHQRRETRIIVQTGERRVVAQAWHAGIVLVVGTIEPFEGVVFFTTPGVDRSDLKRRSGRVFRLQGVQCLFGFRLVTKCVFDHGGPGQSEGLVRGSEMGERAFLLAFLQIKVAHEIVRPSRSGIDIESMLPGQTRPGVLAGGKKEQAKVVPDL